MDDFDFEEFISPEQEAANAMHDIYLNFIEAGFTENQAMRLVVSIFGEALKLQKGDENDDF